MKTAILDVSVERATKEYARWRPGRTPQDQLIARAFRAIARGGKVIDLYESMRLAGCDSQGRPELAIVRADATSVRGAYWGRDGVTFVANKGRHDTVSVPESFFPGLRKFDARATVPIIPPPYRKYKIENYMILFDAAWENVTGDPILLEPLGGALYKVVATWDLTPIEQAVLRGRR